MRKNRFFLIDCIESETIFQSIIGGELSPIWSQHSLTGLGITVHRFFNYFFKSHVAIFKNYLACTDINAIFTILTILHRSSE